jgi:Domain of unknown function (DUF4258)
VVAQGLREVERLHITYSKHARKRMRERAISRQDVSHVMAVLTANRGSAPQPSARKRKTRHSTLGGVPVEVVYTESISQRFHIVTVKVL